ncbi:FG-GAP repeat domain-containing protein [Streptomyces sp. NPDC015346]|uniref:FG-GAP repeat domain-containing protein n=1 Tax=Streptomyces sp. NPDC015346 TaxID=3364954 RepID=UPI0036F7E0CB
MNPHVRPRRATLRRVLGTALVPVLGLGVVAAATPAAFATPAGAFAAASATLDPWAASVPLSDGTAIHGVHDLKTAKDGAVVALWYRVPEDRSKLELVTAVRPAGSAAWGAPHVLTTQPGQRSEAELVVSADGSVTAAWMEFPNDIPPYDEKPGGVFRMSVLAAGATTWSAPSDIMTATDWVHSGKLAGSPSGTLVATWTHSSGRTTELYASVRTAPGQAWSEPIRIDEPEAGAGLSSSAELVYSDQGTATLAFVQAGPEISVVKVVDRTPDGTWTKPVTVSDPKLYATGPTLALGQDGRAVLAWKTQVSPSGGEQTEAIAQRPAGSLVWGAEEPANGFRTGAWRKVVVGPEGDVTLLGVAYDEGPGFTARTTTRSAATGTWSPLKTLSTDSVPDDQFDLTVGADGSAHAIWTQSGKMMTSSRVNGVWSATPTPLSTNTTGYALGRVTVDAANRPVAVWQQSTGDFTTQLRAATTAPLPPKPLPKWRDFSGDGKGDLITLTSAGALTVRTGTGTGSLGTGASATGWPASSLVVPVGDLSGDRCNDLLVRNSAGALTRHDGGCGKAFSPSGPRASLGGGWNIYNSLTSPGDLTGDGRADLLARTTAGELWLYADNGAGSLAPRVRIGTGWQTYGSLVGVGDLNGDTFGDVLARDSAGALWRYYGTGKGTLGARVKAGTGWQVYSTLTGVGDITADGKADLVARDTAGVLWRYDGTGAGAFGARVKLGGGWQMYKTLS